MNMLNLIKWMLTGFPMYFAGISAATAASIAASAAAIGGAALSASSAKGAAKTGQQGAREAAAIDWEKIQQAIENANLRLTEDQMQSLKANLESRGDLQPYANVGRNSLNALSIGMGQGDPQAKQHGIKARQQASKEYQKLIQAEVKRRATSLRDLMKSPAYATMTHAQRIAAQTQIRNESKATFGKLNAGKEKYIEDAFKKSQELPSNAGDLARSFNVQDYRNDPTSGGKAPPDLTKNFDQNRFLELGGHDKGDLTRDFNQNDFLAQGGHDIGDLTRDFDMTEYLASQGRGADALTRDFQAGDFVADPGYQFRLEEGNKGIQGSAAAQGSVLSGAAMKALSRFNQDTASAEYGKVFDRYGQNRANLQNVAFNQQNQFNQNRGDLNQYLQAATGRFNQNRQDLNQNLNSAFDRFNVNRGNAANVYNAAYDRFNNNQTNQFNRLSSIASMGQNAATNQAGFTQNMAARNSAALQNNAQLVGQLYSQGGARQGEYMTQAANANMAGQIGAGNAWSSGIGQVGNSLMQGAYMYGQQKNPNNNNW